MANVISLNIVKRTVGGSAPLLNLPFGRKNDTVYSPAVIRGFKTSDIISTVRNDGTNSYFTAKEMRDMDTQSRKDQQITWFSSDNLITIASKSPDLVILTVVNRLEFLTSINDNTKGVAMNNEAMIFDVNKIMSGAGLVPRPSPEVGTIFQYMEEGNPYPVQYIVNETIAYISSVSSGPILSFDGYEFYVNDIMGNDATAQPGDPLRPWSTFDAAFAAAVTHATEANIIITGGAQVSNANFAADKINIEIKADASLEVNDYTITGSISQTICGKGTLTANQIMTADAAFAGILTIDVGVFISNARIGVWNDSLVNGVVHVACDYSFIGSGSKYLYAVTGTTNGGSFKTNVKHVDGATGANEVNTFFIFPSGSAAGPKIFNFYIASGNSKSSNEGLLCLSAIDSTYLVNAEFNVSYSGNGGSPGLNAILSCYNCTGGVVNLRGTHYITTQGRCALILDSDVTVNDYSTTYYTNANPNRCITLAGGNSIYTQYGKKLSASTSANGSVSIGVTFTSSSSTTDFGNISSTAGSDTFHFKGALKCAYLNVAAIGIMVETSPNLIIDGGIIEMVNSDTLNDAISSAAAEDIKVFGTGYVRGAINANITNTITGTNIVSDAGITANI